MNESITEFLHARIADLKPKSLLTVGITPDVLTPAQENAKPEFEIDNLQPHEIIGHRKNRYDLGVLYLDKSTTQESLSLLSWTRDVLTCHLIVVVPNTCDCPTTDFLALGMTKADLAYVTEYAVYEYDIASYKTTPDWLGAGSWANPELWEKERW